MIKKICAVLLFYICAGTVSSQSKYLLKIILTRLKVLHLDLQASILIMSAELNKIDKKSVDDVLKNISLFFFQKLLDVI
jgi:hypothetical protein